MVRNRLFAAAAVTALGIGGVTTAAVAHSGSRASLQPASVKSADETTTTTADGSTTTTEGPSTPEVKTPEVNEAATANQKDDGAVEVDHQAEGEEIDHDDSTPAAGAPKTASRGTNETGESQNND